MKKLPILYARCENGNIQQWLMTVDGDGYFSTEGIVGGKQTINKSRVAKAKNVGRANESLPEEQAILEAQAKWDKKKKQGYFEKIEDIDKELFVQVMLAKHLCDYEDKLVYPVGVDRKYNGGRVYTVASGSFTRTGEKYMSIPHIYESLAPIFKKFPNFLADGEAYSHEYRFKLNEIMHIVRKSVNVTQEDLKESREKIKLYVYDGYNFGTVTKDTPCFERRKALKELLKGYQYIEVVDYELANSIEEIHAIYNKYVEDGYEGAIIRMNAPYENKRSKNLLKLKPENSSEAVIVEVLEGDGNWAGTCKTIKFQWTGNIDPETSKEYVFDGIFKGDNEARQKFFDEKSQWIGKEVTFLYNGLTGYGVPNYARLDINNCLKK